MYSKLIICLFLSVALQLPSYAANILVLNQDCNDDMFGADDTCADERYNVLNTLIAKGHNVLALDSFDHPDLATLLDANDFLIIPELEDGTCSFNQTAFITDTEKTILKSYVEKGGRILSLGGERNINLLNDIFSLSLGSPTNSTSGITELNTVDAAGTIFENCPATIPNISVTFLLNATMPPSKRCIYDFGGMSSVALFDIGSGYVVYLGYDYFDAGIGCTKESTEWTGCLIESAIAAATFGPTGVPPVPIPTLSQWSQILLLVLLGIAGLIGVRQKLMISL